MHRRPKSCAASRAERPARIIASSCIASPAPPCSRDKVQADPELETRPRPIGRVGRQRDAHVELDPRYRVSVHETEADRGRGWGRERPSEQSCPRRACLLKRET